MPCLLLLHPPPPPQVWDCYGRLLFQSSPLDYAVTSVAWCPSGEMFAAGSFDSLQLCDRMGWAYSKVRGTLVPPQCTGVGRSAIFPPPHLFLPLSSLLFSRPLSHIPCLPFLFLRSSFIRATRRRAPS